MVTSDRHLCVRRSTALIDYRSRHKPCKLNRVTARVITFNHLSVLVCRICLVLFVSKSPLNFEWGVCCKSEPVHYYLLKVFSLS